MAQLFPERFDPRKMDANFLKANFEYFRLSIARDDKNNENCPSYFFSFWPKKLLYFVLNPKKGPKINKIEWNSWICLFFVILG